MTAQEKLNQLQNDLTAMGSLAVAFSGGVDSTFLLRVAHDVLGDRVLAITAQSSTFPGRELKEAIAFAKDLGVRHRVIVSEELDIEGFSLNPSNRCYYCKRELFGKIAAIAREEGIAHIADGSNADDTGDYRPGMQAMREQGAVSPLLAAGLTKQEIRHLSREMGLPTWDKPAFACLSSRIPYGEPITAEKLTMIDQAETALLRRGFRQVRVRHHGNLARVEVGAAEMPRFFEPGLLAEIDQEFRAIGYAYVTLDMRGYRTGSMNEVLAEAEKAGQPA